MHRRSCSRRCARTSGTISGRSLRMADLRARAVLASIAIAAGCSSEHAMTGDATTEGPGAPVQGAAPARAERVHRLRDQIAGLINASACPGAGCEMIAFQPVPAELSPSSEGARILLIDEAITTVAATRYQSRTLAYLAHDGDGTYHPTDVTLQISRDALAVFQVADAFEGPLASEEIGLVAQFGAKFANA